jgi:hypothetical protein
VPGGCDARILDVPGAVLIESTVGRDVADSIRRGLTTHAELEVWEPTALQRVAMVLAVPLRFVLSRTPLWRILPTTALTAAGKAHKILTIDGAEAAFSFGLKHAGRLRVGWRASWPTTDFGYWRLLEQLAYATAMLKDSSKCQAVIDEASCAPWAWAGCSAARAAERLARACFHCGNVGAALRFVDLAVTADETYPEGWHFGSWLKLREGSDDAEAFVRRALSQHPSLPEAILNGKAFRRFEIVTRIRAESAS